MPRMKKKERTVQAAKDKANLNESVRKPSSAFIVGVAAVMEKEHTTEESSLALAFNDVENSNSCGQRCSKSSNNVQAEQHFSSSTKQNGDALSHEGEDEDDRRVSNDNEAMKELVDSKDNDVFTKFGTMNQRRRNEEFHRVVKSGNLDAVRQWLQSRLVDIECICCHDQTTLYEACRRGNLAMVRYLVEVWGAAIDATTYCQWTVLHEAVYRGHLDIVQYLLQQEGGVKLTLAKDNLGETALHKARSVAIASLLLQRAATALGEKGRLELLLAKTGRGRTALHKAESVDMVRLLYSAGGTQLVDMVDDWERQTVLHLKVKDDANMALVQCLIETCEADILQTDQKGYTALHLAVLYYSYDIVEYLSSRGGIELVMAKDVQGQTALHVAVEHGHYEQAKSLVNIGGIELVLVRDNDGKSALHLLADRNTCHCEFAKYLLGVGGRALIDVTDNMGRTVLHRFVYLDSIVMVQHMVHEYGVNVDCADHQGRTALHQAICHNRSTWYMVRHLLQQCGANARATDRNGCTALHLACDFNETDTARHCFKESIVGFVRMLAPAGVNVADRNGRSALHYAVSSSFSSNSSVTVQFGIEIVQRLVQTCGANVNAKDNDGRTALHQTVECANSSRAVGLAQFLVDTCGADVDAADNFGRTALAIACIDRAPSVDLVEYLVGTCGANIHTVDHVGRTPLHGACSIAGNDAAVAVLLSHSPLDVAEYIDARDNAGCTTLHCACHTGNFATVQLLVDHHANVEAVGNEGRTTLMTACSSKVDCLAKVRLLVQAGADTEATDNSGLSALHYASTMGQNVNVIRLLLAFHAVEDMQVVGPKPHNDSHSTTTSMWITNTHQNESLMITQTNG